MTTKNQDDPGRRIRSPVRHRLDFNLDAGLFAWISGVAAEAGLVHPGGRPRIAELARVLLASTALAGQQPQVRLAAALYSHTVLSLAESFALSVADLRSSLRRLAIEATGVPSKDPGLEPVQRWRGNARPSGTLTLVLDDLLHEKLVECLALRGAPTQERGKRAAPEDVRLIRGLLREARADYRQHRPVVEAYAKVVAASGDRIREAVRIERDAIAQAFAR